GEVPRRSAGRGPPYWTRGSKKSEHSLREAVDIEKELRSSMRIPPLLAALVFLSACTTKDSTVPSRAAPPPPPIVLTHVTVIDPLRGSEPEMAVVIQDRRIVTVGAMATVAIPPGATIHEESGRFVVPGFWDTHAHLSQVGAAEFPLLMMNGITSV